MDYGKILKRSWQVTWKNRPLWLFGILLALFGEGGGGGGGGFPGGGGGGTGSRGGDTFPGRLPQIPPIDWNAIGTLIAVVICVVLILAIIGIVLRLVSRGALIGLVNELEKNQTAPTIRRGFSIGLARFWPLLGIAILINLPIILLVLILLVIAALPILGALGTRANVPFDQILLMGGTSSILVLLCGLACVAGIALVIKPIYEFIVRVCVVGSRGALDSIREGWRLVRTNLGSVFVLYILQIAVGIGFGIAMIPVALILIAIPVILVGVIFFAANAPIIAIIVGVVLAVPILGFLIWISGLYRTFESTIWTEGYLQLAK